MEIGLYLGIFVSVAASIAAGVVAARHQSEHARKKKRHREAEYVDGSQGLATSASSTTVELRSGDEEATPRSLSTGAG